MGKDRISLLNCGGEGADVDVLEVEKTGRVVGVVVTPITACASELSIISLWLCFIWLSSEMARISTNRPGMPKSCWPSGHVLVRTFNGIALCPAAGLPRMAVFPLGPSSGLKAI